MLDIPFPFAPFSPLAAPAVKWRPHQLAAAEKLHESDEEHALAEITVAGGKSLILARLAQLAQESSERVLILAHNNQLVRHNMAACQTLGLAPQPCCASVGVNVFGRITVGTIQTVANRVRHFKDVSKILIDEAHLIPPDEDSQYRELFAAIPKARSRGVTGTPFRGDGSGSLEATYGPILYRYTFADALADEWVKPLRLIEADAPEIDTKGVKVNSKGEWSDKELSHRGIPLAPQHCAAMIDAMNAEERKRIIVFACDIEHADVLAAELRKRGETAQSVHSKSKNEKTAVGAFRAGQMRWLVSVAKFTTGFDEPGIDGIVLTRPIRSLVYYVQGLGRGARITPLAPDCCVVDFGGNVSRHGALDMVKVPESRQPRDKDGEGLGPCRTCKACMNDYARFFGPVCPLCDFDHRSLRVVGSDLRIAGAKDADLVTEVRQQPKWVLLNGPPTKAVHRPGWMISTEAGKAKWWPMHLPPDLTHAFLRWDARSGLVVDGLADARGQLHSAR